MPSGFLGDFFLIILPHIIVYTMSLESLNGFIQNFKTLSNFVAGRLLIPSVIDFFPQIPIPFYFIHPWARASIRQWPFGE